PANLSAPRDANRLESSFWLADRTWTANLSASAKASMDLDDLANDQSTIGGSSDTELKLLAVTPTGTPPGPRVVTIVTPVANLPSAFLKSLASTAVAAVEARAGELTAPGPPRRPVRSCATRDAIPPVSQHTRPAT